MSDHGPMETCYFNVVFYDKELSGKEKRGKSIEYMGEKFAKHFYVKKAPCALAI